MCYKDRVRDGALAVVGRMHATIGLCGDEAAAERWEHRSGVACGCRDGLRELFYGVYQKDTDKCLDALETMGVLVGGDRTSIKRTAEFFLKSFDTRLAEQRKERQADPDSQKSFKAQRTKEDSKERRKQVRCVLCLFPSPHRSHGRRGSGVCACRCCGRRICGPRPRLGARCNHGGREADAAACVVQILSNIGEDLLVASADKPFRFPAEFTFVVRSFTVLDGIGKSLSPRFDISEISAPYARELILDGKPAFTRLQDKVAKGVRRNNKAVKGLFDSTLKIDEINEALKRCAALT